MVILDTNIIIDHLRKRDGDSLLIQIADKFPSDSLCISVLTIQELYAGKSTLNPDKEKLLLMTISPLKVLPYNFEIAKMAGKIDRDTDKIRGFTDTAIAATAIHNNIELATLNKKDFQDIPDLQLFDI